LVVDELALVVGGGGASSAGRWLRSELCERLETTSDRNVGTVTVVGGCGPRLERKSPVLSPAADADLRCACG
jgi:hypothetical protein